MRARSLEGVRERVGGLALDEIYRFDSDEQRDSRVVREIDII